MNSPSLRKQLSAILIAGPTASGKSALALSLAEALGGAIINADASQVYAELRILTARPSQEAMRRVPHYLYGHVSARERYSVARWLEDARLVLDEARAARRVPIVVGGTGLYFLAALEGLAELPPIPAEVRAEAVSLYDELGPEGFRERLAALDPEAARELALGDRYRARRAFEVVKATGKPLRYWLKGPHRPLLESDEAVKLVVIPERAALYARCDERFDAMIEAGALDEVRALLLLDLGPTLPAMKAVGMGELAGVLRGEIGLEVAVELAKRRTRNYIKRQLTWIRGQMADWQALETADIAHVCELLDPSSSIQVDVVGTFR